MTAMSLSKLTFAACILAAVMLAGCASPPSAPLPPTDSIILLPEKDGRSTAVIVRQGTSELVLDRPYAGARAGGSGAAAPYQSSADDVQARFGQALAAQPPRPLSFTLYFVIGGNTLTEESRALVERAFAEIATRPVPDILIVGHTDTVGSGAANDTLSLQRAQFIAREIERRGVAAANISAAGRGERELLVPTADNVAEPRNRRVEIIVR